MQADTSSTLKDIRDITSPSIVSELLDLQANGKFGEQSLDWVDKLEIISHSASRGGEDAVNYPGRKRLWREFINTTNGIGKAKFVAVSYPCQPGSNDSNTHDAYLVQQRDDITFAKSDVRDQVFDRVIAYVNYLVKEGSQIRGFWIDKECINQKNPEEQQRAIQSMEHVYRRSAFPLALLSKRIKSEDDLRTLIYILTKKPLTMELEQITKTLDLLDHVTSDPWWNRGWTFQEDYCASTRICLLIPHCLSLEGLKNKHRDLLGSLEGELCIESAHFREQATKFCVVYGKNSQSKERYDRILRRAVKYTVLLEELDYEGYPTIKQSMSPTIISDVGDRGIEIESDRLAVIANCLDYSTRLDARNLENRSLSLSMLALFLLNGEILMNGGTNTQKALKDNIFDYLKKQSLRVQTPDIDYKLTFIKRCRFRRVNMCQEGIRTSGCLWRLKKVIEDPTVTLPPRSRGRGYSLDNGERRRLGQLAKHLRSGDSGSRYREIASDIDEYLKEDKWWERDKAITFSKEYKDIMAREVIKAMEDRSRNRLKLGCLPSHKHKPDQYRGVFISEDDHPWPYNDKETYVFTAVYEGKNSKDGFDKYVSLEVEVLGSPKNRPVRLVIKRWINGLFFFDRKSPVTNVVFPWPESLKR